MEGPRTAAHQPEGTDATLLGPLVLLEWTECHFQGPALPRGPDRPQGACRHRTGQLPMGEKGPFGPDMTPSTGCVTGPRTRPGGPTTEPTQATLGQLPAQHAARQSHQRQPQKHLPPRGPHEQILTPSFQERRFGAGL